VSAAMRSLAPIYMDKYSEEFSGGAVLYSDNSHTVTQKLALIKGGKYRVPTLVGYRLLTVTEVDYDKGIAKAENDSVVAWLQHNSVTRTWTSQVAGNKNALVKITVTV
jgi:hypothetical protein